MMGLTQAEVYDSRWMKEMGAPERALTADLRSKAFQVLTEYRGIQQMKKRATITISMRMTRFLACSLASEVLLRARSVLAWVAPDEAERVGSSTPEAGFLDTCT